MVFCCSCATIEQKKPPVPPFTWLTDSKKFTLLPTECIETHLDSQQLITASFNGRIFQAALWVKADETVLDITIVNEMGASLGELSYRNGSVSFSSSVIPGMLKPEYIVADFQLCFYNANELGKALEKSAFTFEETEKGRRVLNGNTVIYEIEYGRNIVRLNNKTRGYSYTIEGNF